MSSGNKLPLSAIFSLSGLVLTSDEQAFFRRVDPLGFILFGRNCQSPAQVRALTDSLRDLTGRSGQDCPILIDQEGGRVQRLSPPLWRARAPMGYFGDMARTQSPQAARAALRNESLRMAEDLLECGLTVNCAPVLDLRLSDAHDIIGDRAFSDDPACVSDLGACVCETFLAAGITPVIKHIPGHGRARADSHLALPVVPESREALEPDFKPFRDLAMGVHGAKIWAMTAHIVYPALDPDHAASVSSRIISGTIRRDIGFSGVLLSDDLGMAALDSHGTIATRGTAVIEAGCDLALYCGGVLAEMESLADVLPRLSPATLSRLRGIS